MARKHGPRFHGTKEWMTNPRLLEEWIRHQVTHIHKALSRREPISQCHSTCDIMFTPGVIGASSLICMECGSVYGMDADIWRTTNTGTKAHVPVCPTCNRLGVTQWAILDDKTLRLKGEPNVYVNEKKVGFRNYKPYRTKAGYTSIKERYWASEDSSFKDGKVVRKSRGAVKLFDDLKATKTLVTIHNEKPELTPILRNLFKGGILNVSREVEMLLGKPYGFIAVYPKRGYHAPKGGFPTWKPMSVHMKACLQKLHEDRIASRELKIKREAVVAKAAKDFIEILGLAKKMKYLREEEPAKYIKHTEWETFFGRRINNGAFNINRGRSVTDPVTGTSIIFDIDEGKWISDRYGIRFVKFIEEMNDDEGNVVVEQTLSKGDLGWSSDFPGYETQEEWKDSFSGPKKNRLVDGAKKKISADLDMVKLISKYKEDSKAA